MKISRIEILSDRADCVDREVLTAMVDLNQYFFQINKDNLRQRISGKFLCVKSTGLDYQFPNGAVLKVLGRVGMFRLAEFSDTIPTPDATEPLSSASARIDWSKPSLTDEQFLVDESGVVFKKSQEKNTPLLFLSRERVEIGRRMNPELIQKFQKIFDDLVKLREESYLETTAGDVGFIAKKVEADLIIISPTKIIFSLEKDVSRQLASLQLILRKNKIDAGEIDMIDLRFDKPVIRYVN